MSLRLSRDRILPGYYTPFGMQLFSSANIFLRSKVITYGRILMLIPPAVWTSADTVFRYMDDDLAEILKSGL